MGGSKSKAGTTTTAPTTVWDAQAPYLQDTYQQAYNIYGNTNNAAAQGSVDQLSLIHISEPTRPY